MAHVAEKFPRAMQSNKVNAMAADQLGEPGKWSVAMAMASMDRQRYPVSVPEALIRNLEETFSKRS